jgi:hypothetical protein
MSEQQVLLDELPPPESSYTHVEADAVPTSGTEGSCLDVVWHYCCVDRVKGEWYENTRWRTFLYTVGLLVVMIGVVTPLLLMVLMYPLGLLMQLLTKGSDEPFTFSPVVNVFAGEFGFVTILVVVVFVGMLLFGLVRCGVGCAWLCGDCRKTYQERYTPIADA